MEDGAIVDLFWERDETALAAAAEKYGKYCHSISRSILGNDEDAEECVNDAYMAAWKSIPPHRPEQLSAYLGKLTRNISINRFKRQTRKKRGGGHTEVALSELEDCVPDSFGVEQMLDELVLQRAISDFLYSQPVPLRRLFVWRYWYLLSISEIAAKSGMERSKVSSQLFGMRSDLKKYLEKEGVIL